jgi:hypothetical protein
VPACSNSRVTGTYDPLVSGLVRPLSTTWGDGPIRSTAESTGRATEVPDTATLAA